MKTSTLALRNLLASRMFNSAPLITFELVGGPVLRYCGADIDLIVGGRTFLCGGQTGPFFFRNTRAPSCSWEAGTKSSSMQFDVSPGGATIEGAPFLTACRLGFFDGAEFTYERVYMPTATPTDTSAGSVVMFGGRVADVEIGRSNAAFTVKSHLELLNKPWPHDVFQAGCINTLYDASCTLNPASFSASGAVTGAATTRGFQASGAIGAAGLFDLGKIIMTSGANIDLARPVRSWDGSILKLSSPLAATPQVGDTFTVYRGCDKTPTTCMGRFANLANFRGFPTIPVAETAL